MNTKMLKVLNEYKADNISELLALKCMRVLLQETFREGYNKGYKEVEE